MGRCRRGPVRGGRAALLRGVPLILALGAAHAPAAPGGTPAPAEVFTFRLQQAAVTRSASFRPGPDGAPAAGSPRDQSEATLEFRIGARDRALLDGLVPGLLEGRFQAVDDTGQSAVSARGEVVSAGEQRLLRLRLVGLSARAAGLRLLAGEVRAYPRARRIRFHVPWLKDELPLSVQFDGGTATLRRFQLVESDSTLWISLRAPEGFRLASGPETLSASALDIDGNLVNGGAITRIEAERGGAEPEFRFFAPGLRRTPSRLMLDALFVAGDPEPVKFQLRNLSFGGRRE